MVLEPRPHEDVDRKVSGGGAGFIARLTREATGIRGLRVCNCQLVPIDNILLLLLIGVCGKYRSIVTLPDDLRRWCAACRALEQQRGVLLHLQHAFAFVD